MKPKTASLVARYIAAKNYKIDKGQQIWYGKYKNMRGVVEGFKMGEKGDAIIIVAPLPNPTGRKKPKELKLFKIRPREEPDRD